MNDTERVEASTNRILARVEKLNEFVQHLEASDNALDKMYLAFGVKVGYIGYPYDLQAVYFAYNNSFLCLCVQTFVVGFTLLVFYALFNCCRDVYENPHEYGAHDIPIVKDLVTPRREGDSSHARSFRRQLKSVRAKAEKRQKTLAQTQEETGEQDFDKLIANQRG